MIFEATPIPGAFVVRMECLEDERGFFARVWCREEFAAQGIEVEMVQASVSFNRLRGHLARHALRTPPALEGKLVRCSRAHLRRDPRPAPRFALLLPHMSLVLDDKRLTALYIPPGVAHGFQALGGRLRGPVHDDRGLPAGARRGRALRRSGVRHPLAAAGGVIAERDRALSGLTAHAATGAGT